MDRVEQGCDKLELHFKSITLKKKKNKRITLAAESGFLGDREEEGRPEGRDLTAGVL